jgi:hypothetical protein
MGAIDPPPVPGQAQFVAWWQSLPREDGVPTLAAALDKAEPTFAPWTCIIDMAIEEVLKIRLFGTGLVQAFGEITGHNYLDYMPNDLRGPIKQSNRVILDTPCGRLTRASAITNSGREVVLGMVSLPVAHKGVLTQIAKYVRIIDTLDYREGLSKVYRVQHQSWLDIGAGLPQQPPHAVS